ncbi:MAG: hypothetical protein HN353_02900 [Bdellovibrionales bacterium]|nr:hypothetical protein [Bdellovibrionales bacterium]MBT3527146.1 hypothetical protein [Bdellovibrionales bacterium]MBT7670492.1 hypothetical protein [Bdellovibrionales bacterium]MBT7766658.1 hypothetical protein [Bdellovibrionales bacterium]
MKLRTLYIALSISLFTTQLLAADMDDKKFHCGDISDQAITAMYIAGDKLSFQALSMGDYFSIYNDSSSPYTISRINQQVSQLEKVGARMQIDFNQSDCIFETNNNHLDWRCYKRSAGILGKGLEYRSASFYLYTKGVQSPYSNRTEYIVGLALETELPGETLIENIYYLENGSGSTVCRFNPNK